MQETRFEDAENAAIREKWQQYRAASRRAKDLKIPAPNLTSFAMQASEDSRVSRTFDSIYGIFKRARKNNRIDPIAQVGRPSKKPDALQLHAFATTADQMVSPIC